MLIDYSGMEVGSLSDKQLTSLRNLKFSEKPSSDPKVITRDRLPANTRIIPLGYMVTMDYDETRLNVYLDANNNVERVKLG